MNAIQAVPSGITACTVLGSTTQTVVLTNAQSGSTGNMLSLPLGLFTFPFIFFVKDFLILIFLL